MLTSRRSLLKTGAALTVASWSGALAAPSPILDSSFDPWVEVHRDNLRHNVQQIYLRVGSRPILAVVKNNAYGMGVVNAGRLLSPLPAVAGFAVVKLHEAASLRDAGIRKPILLMGSCTEQELEEAVARNITPIVYTPMVRPWSESRAGGSGRSRSRSLLTPGLDAKEFRTTGQQS